MSRVEPQPEKTQTRSYSGLKKGFKALGFVLMLPFKISLRVLVITLLLAGFIIVVRTGIWDIPVASAILYRAPEPVHEVTPAAVSETLLALQVEEKVRMQGGAVELTLSEEDLTELLRESLAKKESQPFESYQFSVTDDFIEFYGRLQSNSRVIIRAHIVPEIEDGGLELRIKKVYVGQIGVPLFAISSHIVEAFTPPLLSTILETMDISDIQLSDGTLVLYLIRA